MSRKKSWKELEQEGLAMKEKVALNYGNAILDNCVEMRKLDNLKGCDVSILKYNTKDKPNVTFIELDFSEDSNSIKLIENMIAQKNDEIKKLLQIQKALKDKLEKSDSKSRSKSHFDASAYDLSMICKDVKFDPDLKGI